MTSDSDLYRINLGHCVAVLTHSGAVHNRDRLDEHWQQGDLIDVTMTVVDLEPLPDPPRKPSP